MRTCTMDLDVDENRAVYYCALYEDEVLVDRVYFKLADKAYAETYCIKWLLNVPR